MPMFYASDFFLMSVKYKIEKYFFVRSETIHLERGIQSKEIFCMCIQDKTEINVTSKYICVKKIIARFHSVKTN